MSLCPSFQIRRLLTREQYSRDALYWQVGIAVLPVSVN